MLASARCLRTCVADDVMLFGMRRCHTGGRTHAGNIKNVCLVVFLSIGGFKLIVTYWLDIAQ